MQRLSEGLESRRNITLVSAPAGFGKTTCISEWIHSLDLPFSWLSLDPTDDDPGRFFIYFIAAFQRIDPNFGHEIEAVIKAGKIPPNEIISTSIINDILEFNTRFVLVLDNLHTIQDHNIIEVLKSLLSNHPNPLHLVLITREDPPLPLARLRANNKLTEIRAKDLRITGNEIEFLLNDVMALSLSKTDIDLLEEKTEGWIAGLQLAGLSMKDKKNPSEFISRLSGNHQFILSYLTEQVLDQQPQEIQKFLLETAILEKFNSDLCNAVTKRSDSKKLLEHLQHANLFLIPLDEEHQWYRYHNFFTDLLRDLQKRSEDANLADLHRCACEWYAKAGMPNDAVHHALAAKDYPTAMALLENHASDMLMQGYAKTVDTWIQAIPDEWHSKSLKTRLAFAWAYLLQGAYPSLIQTIDHLEPISSERYDASLKAERLVMKSLVLYMRGKLDDCMEMIDQALEILPEQDHRVLGLAYYVQAHVRLLKNDYTQAINILHKSIQHSREAKSLVPEMMSTISLIGASFERGKLHQAYEIATQAVRRLEISAVLPPVGAFVYLALGDIYYQWNRIEEGQQVTRRAFQLSSLGGLNTGLIYCRILFSRLFQIKQNFDSGAMEIQGALDLLPLEVPEYIRQDVAAQQVRVYLDLGQLDSAKLVLQNHGLIFDPPYDSPNILTKPSNPFSMGMLSNCLLRTLLHQDLDTVGLRSGVELAEQLITEAKQRDQFLVSLEGRLLRAQLYAKMGNLQACTTDIVSALEQGQQEGFIGIFIEQGPPVARLIEKTLDNENSKTIDKEYIKIILAAFSPSQTRNLTFEPLIEPLTERELDVLILMADGLKYKEIAARLFVSLNTVRYHVKAIYGKLNVNNRTQAIQKARKRQIL